jgi:ankyrin repeat protein
MHRMAFNIMLVFAAVVISGCAAARQKSKQELLKCTDARNYYNENTFSKFITTDPLTNAIFASDFKKIDALLSTYNLRAQKSSPLPALIAAIKKLGYNGYIEADGSLPEGADKLVSSKPVVAIVNKLIQFGANPNTTDDSGMTPLMLLGLKAKYAQKDYVLLADILIKSSANVNAIDRAGQTALNYATRANSVGMVQFLLRHGAKKDIKNCAGQTAEMIARKAGHEKLAGLLKSRP